MDQLKDDDGLPSNWNPQGFECDHFMTDVCSTTNPNFNLQCECLRNLQELKLAHDFSNDLLGAAGVCFSPACGNSTAYHPASVATAQCNSKICVSIIQLYGESILATGQTTLDCGGTTYNIQETIDDPDAQVELDETTNPTEWAIIIGLSVVFVGVFFFLAVRFSAREVPVNGKKKIQPNLI